MSKLVPIIAYYDPFQLFVGAKFKAIALVSLLFASGIDFGIYAVGMNRLRRLGGGGGKLSQ